MSNVKRLDALTSLRFFAAISVVVGHAGEYPQFSGYDVPNIALNKSHAVSFFFVLSGFILRYVYKKFNGYHDCLVFFYARIARVLPIHLVTLAICLIAFGPDVFNASNGDFAKTLIANVSLIHSWIPKASYYFSFNWVSWSISTELLFYLSFPFMIFLVKRLNLNFILIPITLAILVIFYCAHYKIPINGSGAIDVTGLVYVNPIVRLPEFCMGILACCIYEKINKENKIISGASSYIGFLSILMLFTAPYLVNNIGRYFQNDDWRPVSLYLFQNGMGLFFAITILSISLGSGFFNELLSNRALVWLGEISFSLYMIHQIVLRYIIRNLNEHALVNPDTYFMCYIFLSLIFSAILYHLVEKPSRNAIIGLKVSVGKNIGFSKKTSEASVN